MNSYEAQEKFGDHTPKFKINLIFNYKKLDKVCKRLYNMARILETKRELRRWLMNKSIKSIQIKIVLREDQIYGYRTILRRGEI